MSSQPQPAPEITREYVIGGRVQGVGFRPFVFRLAHHLALRGWVQNRLGEVVVLVQGDIASVERFAMLAIEHAPPLAQPVLRATRDVHTRACADFRIRASGGNARVDIHVPPDFFACDECLRELADPADRRYRYPFINCTQCGPRYTLIRSLPYDRANTTMVGFALCPACRREYENPLDRRFHAQPLACPVCGPQLRYQDTNAKIDTTAEALAAAIAALRVGHIVAVKGIGGYHLMCDARSDEAVARLRAAKPRPHKPLAVMLPRRGHDGLDAVRREVVLDAVAASALCDPARPIVLAPRAPEATLSPLIAPGLDEVGVLLPYSPLHQLLLEGVAAPLVATSANISGEPVLTADADVEHRLAHVAQAYLHHNRPIQRPADDPVLRVIAGRARPLRLGRGTAPLELELPFRLREPLLAVGGHMKSTVALAWDARVVISPHIGDLDTPRGLDVFQQVAGELQTLYGIPARRLVCDAHRGYASSRWAHAQQLPCLEVFHHHAHAAAIAGEFNWSVPWLVFTWDGVGLGADGTLWGGEALLGRPGIWQRVAHMRAFALPGGEKAGREPWRSALALCWETDTPCSQTPGDTELLRQAWQRGLNAPRTTAVGRLFDAAAALLGLSAEASFEGQGPMLLEAAATRGGDVSGPPLPLRSSDDGSLVTDWAPLLTYLMDTQRSVAERAAGFHAALAAALVDQAQAVRERYGVTRVGLAGGVFQNKRLSEAVLGGLHDEGFEARLGERIPANDAGLCYGQIIEAGARSLE